MSGKYWLKNWQELPIGGVIVEGGNAQDYETGTWRTWRPVWNKEHCTNCLNCWIFCPEEAYNLCEGKTKQGKERREIKDINYFHCKGCGLCVKVCPVNKKGGKTAIKFIKESD